MTTKQAYKQKMTLIKVSVSTVLSEIVVVDNKHILLSTTSFTHWLFCYQQLFMIEKLSQSLVCGGPFKHTIWPVDFAIKSTDDC